MVGRLEFVSFQHVEQLTEKGYRLGTNEVPAHLYM